MLDTGEPAKTETSHLQDALVLPFLLSVPDAVHKSQLQQNRGMQGSHRMTVNLGNKCAAEQEISRAKSFAA